MIPAFSTVACPDWTIDRVASRAAEWGFEGVEFRTFGEDSREFACDPALSSGVKVRDLMASAGVRVVGLGTSVRFDGAIHPPVIGHLLSDTERSVRDAKRAIDLAVSIEAPLVRVFGFQGSPGEPSHALRARIVKRLGMALDHARNTGIRLVLENGGAFPRGSDVAALIAEISSPLLGACYSLAPAVRAGESPSVGVSALGGSLWSARVKDLRAGKPCPLGEGELPARELVRELARAGFAGPVIFEWDRAWVPGLAAAESVLPGAARSIFQWLSEGRGVSRASAVR
ncbi:MAG: sugar phosphate isomerase/epimerase [Phycisphaerae bacterium]|nr:sugar phosphate isomerase/epimerase [Phycisphaerae bacterium]